MEPHSIYAQFFIDHHELEGWLQSQCPSPVDFCDWEQMNPSWEASWQDEFPKQEHQSIAELLEAWKCDEFNQSPLYTNYDEDAQVFTLFQAFFDENLISIAIGISLLRGVQHFCSPNKPSYVLVAPLLWDDGITALLEIRQESSRFLAPDHVPSGLVEAAQTLLAAQMQEMSDD